jgi:hypothetical protein
MKNKLITTVLALCRAQQGDLLLIKLDALPAGSRMVTAKGRCVLAHGESGHSHVIDVPETDAELIQIGERMLLSLAKEATVVHEEHKPITLTAGIWEIGRVREKDWFADMVRPVQD